MVNLKTFKDKSILFLSLSLLSVSFFAQAQTRDRASLTYESLMNGTRTAELNVSERVFLDEEGSKLLTVGIQYRSLNIGGAQGELKSARWNVLAPQFSYMTSLSDQDNLIIQVRPGFFGNDLSEVSKSFRFEGAVLWDRIRDEKLTYGFGIARGSNFGRVLIVPLAHILYFANENWMFDVLLPVKAEAWYLPTPKWEFGLSFQLVGAQYALAGTNLTGTGTHLEFANGNLGPAVRYQLFEKFYLHADVGYTILRRFRIMNEKTEVTNFDPKREAFARAGLMYRF